MKKGGDVEGYITRAEVAKALGKSKTTIRRMEEAGTITPIRGANGVWLFRVADVAKLNSGASISAMPRARPYVATAAQSDADVGAKVFTLLEEGKSAVAVVCELRHVHPDVVEGYAAKWARMKGMMLFSQDDIRRLERSLRLRSVADSTDLTNQIVEAATTLQTCRNCNGEGVGDAQAVYCIGCTKGFIGIELKNERRRRSEKEAAAQHQRTHSVRDPRPKQE